MTTREQDQVIEGVADRFGGAAISAIRDNSGAVLVQGYDDGEYCGPTLRVGITGSASAATKRDISRALLGGRNE